MHQSTLILLGFALNSAIAAPFKTTTSAEPSPAEVKAAIDLFNPSKRQVGEIAAGLGVLGGLLSVTAGAENLAATPRAISEKRQVGEIAAGLGVLGGLLSVTAGAENLAATPRAVPSTVQKRQVGEVAAGLGLAASALGVISGGESVVSATENLSATPRAIPEKRQFGEIGDVFGLLTGAAKVADGAYKVAEATPRAAAPMHKRYSQPIGPTTTSNSVGQMSPEEVQEGVRQIGEAAIGMAKSNSS